MKRHILTGAVCAILLLGLAGCAGDESYTVTVLLTEAEGYTVTGENPITVPAGSDAVFHVTLEEGYNYAQSDGGSVWNEGTLTVPAVYYPTTVNLTVSDADAMVKFFVDNDTGGGIVSAGTEDYFFYPGTRLTLTAEPHEGYYFAGWTLDTSLDNGGVLLSTDPKYRYEIPAERTEVYGNFYKIEEETAVSPVHTMDNLNGPTQIYGTWGIQGNESVHTVIYHANGGTVTGYGSETYTDQVSTAVYSCPNTLADKGYFTREGYVLLEYNTKADGSGTAVPCGGKIAPAGETTELYCIWAEYSAPEDFRYEKNDSGMTVTGYSGDDEILVIPEMVSSQPVTRIASGAVQNRNFHTVVIPKTVETVEDGAFRDCENLETLYLFDSIKYISDGSFTDLSGWKHLRLGAVRDPVFSSHEDATFCRKWEKLLLNSLNPETKNLVVCSGSSSYYGLATPLLEELLGGEYSVVNFGNVATCSVSFFMDGAADLLDGDDIIVQAPETAYGGEMGDPYFYWVIYRIIEHSYDFLYRVDDIGLYYNVLNALTEYNGCREYMEALDYDIFSTNVDENGDITLTMPNGPDDVYFGVPITFWQINRDWLENLNRMYDRIIADTGCRIYFSFAPFNYNAVAGDSRDTGTHETLDAMLKETLRVPVISYVWDYMFAGKYMYNSDYHLGEEGRQIRTKQLAEDILAQFAKEAAS